MQNEIMLAPEIVGEIEQAKAQAAKIVVVDQASRDKAVEFIKGVKGWRKKITDFFGPMKEKAYAAHKEIVSKEKSFTDIADAAEKQAKKAVTDFDAVQEAKRVAEEKRLRAEAEAKAEAERQRLLAEAASITDEEGKQAVLEQAAMVEATPIVVVPTVQKSGNDSTRKVWKARVVDDTLIPRRFLMVNAELLDAFAKDTKGTQKVAGVEFYEQPILSVR